MSVIKKTFEVDKFLTRELLLRNPDNSCPPVNQLILTDGNGGTYLSPLSPSTPTTGFNEITLVDSQAKFLANKPYNNLNIKQGAGVLISKQTISNQDYLTFQVTGLVPSSFFGISTPTGIVYADSQSSILKMVAYDGIKINASTNNSLYIGGTPAFGPINLSTSRGNFSLVPSNSISSLSIQEGFGINLTQTSLSSFSITAAISSALNSINLPNGRINFLNSYNQINLSSAGTTQISLTNSTITFNSNGFSEALIPFYSSGLYSTASTAFISTILYYNIIQSISTGNSLIFAPSYGLAYSSIGSQIQIRTDLPSSFSYISTSRGTVSAYKSTNTLTLNNGYGIDYVVDQVGQNITIKLASTFISQISTESGIITASNQSIANFRQGKSIEYSTSSDNALYINSKDYNRIDIIDGQSGIVNASLFATLNNKTFQIVQGPGMQIIGNTNNNRISMASISSIYISGPQYAFTYLKIYSTASYLGENLTSFQYTQTINAPPIAQAVFGLVPVAPLQSYTDVANNNVYLGLDVSSLTLSTTILLNSTFSIFSSYTMNQSTLTMLTSALSSQSIQTSRINVSSLYVGESLVITKTPSISSLIIASKISSLYTETAILTPSTLGTLSTPLITFNYPSSTVGINLLSSQIQATLHVGGTVLAENFATYSDSSLKNFKSPFHIDKTDLEALKPWNFTWKSSAQEDVGFAAEDVEKILPSAVQRGPNGLLMVDYSKLTVLSLAALRDTNQRLNSIESTLQFLTDKL